jgi:hypothetical protein
MQLCIILLVSGLNIGKVVIARDDLPASQMRASIDDLNPDSLYRVFVSAKTAQGSGERYFIDVRTTYATDPSKYFACVCCTCMLAL